MRFRDEEQQLVAALGAARYWSKRATGIPSERSDGSLTSARTDTQAIGAEYFAAEGLGEPFNPTIGARGDGGADFVFGLRTEVIWLGEQDEGVPRRTGHLLVNPDEPHRWADIYVLVSGNAECGYEFAGWTTHARLVQNPKRDFGYGMRYQMELEELYPIEALLRLKRRDEHVRP